MQGFLQSATLKAVELAAAAEKAAAMAREAVEATLEAPPSAPLLVAVAHGGPAGLRFACTSDAPGTPVLLHAIAPDGPVALSHPQLVAGSQLVQVNGVRRNALPQLRAARAPQPPRCAF